jgi:hypothetical protein
MFTLWQAGRDNLGTLCLDWHRLSSPRMAAEDPANSPDEIAVFQAYVDLINSERETLWARHNTMLVANSLIIGALAISPAALWENKWAALAMLSAGLLINAAWVGIAAKGGRRYDDMLILPQPSLRRASSTFPTRSQKPSATARKLGFITLSCW